MRQNQNQNQDQEHAREPRPDTGDPDGAPEFHEPAPLPTAFGAASVGDAVAASAMASGRPEDERDPRGEDTARPGDGAPGRTDAFDDLRADPTAGDRLHDPARWAAGTPTAARHDLPGGAAGAAAIEPGETRQAGRAGMADRDTGAAVAAGAAGYGSPAPAMVDPDASAAAGVGVAGAIGTGAAARLTGAATLLEPAAAQDFRDRWRDVRLRLDADPAAAAEAQSLVDEVIRALAAALAERQRQLGDWQRADDTEQRRVAVRRYSDFLDRVLGH